MTPSQRTTIIDRCRKAKACQPEFDKLLTANTDEEFLAVIVRNLVWCNNNDILPPAVIETLSRNESLYVRWSLALNPKTPAAALEILAYDLSPYVRRNVAKNPKAPSDALEVLSLDADPRVRQSVARNSKTPA